MGLNFSPFGYREIITLMANLGVKYFDMDMQIAWKIFKEKTKGEDD